MLGQAHAPRRRAARHCRRGLLRPRSSGGRRSRAVAVRTVERRPEGRERRARVAGALGRARASTRSTRSLARARARLAQLERQADALRREQVALAAEMKVALERRPRLAAAARVARPAALRPRRHEHARDHLRRDGRSTTRSTELDNLEHVTSINNERARRSCGTRRRASATTSRALDLARGQARGRDARAGGDDARARRGAGRAGRVHRRPAAAARAELRCRSRSSSRRRTRPGVRTQQLAARTTTAPARGDDDRDDSAGTAGRSPSRRSPTRCPASTASGLPVGWGVVAVDPSVIPLGTHMTVPGYGEAVAADTGCADQGRDHRPLVPDASPWRRPGAAGRSRSPSTRLPPLPPARHGARRTFDPQLGQPRPPGRTS